jgi:YVTN family beta-propeller protein
MTLDINNYTSAQIELHKRTLYEIANNTSPQEISSIQVGESPFAIGVNYLTNMIYVGNGNDNTVSVIDGNTHTKIGKDIPVGRNPYGIAVNVLTNLIYVSNDNSTVSVIDGNTHTKIGKDIPVGRDPYAIVVNIDTNKIYVSNSADKSISIIDGNTNTKIGKDIPVGKLIERMDINERTNMIYVSNSADDSISIMDGNTTTKIGKDIPVGKGPFAIGVNERTNMIYVGNYFDNTVSVIDGNTNTKIGKDIPVGKGPYGIDVNTVTNRIYTINDKIGTVSVIDGNTNTKIGKDILVGRLPSGIVANLGTNAIYVTKYYDNSVSVIDGKTNKILAGITLQISPPNSAHIKCDNLTAPLSLQIYINQGAKCTAFPNPGYEFISWGKNLQDNSTQFLQGAPDHSIYDDLLNFLHLESIKPEFTITITNFGSFTANFKELPTPIPSEYLATLFAVVISAFIGSWLTPTLIEWRKTKNHGKKLEHYHNEIENLDKDGRINKNDISHLDGLRNNITDDYTRGKITKDQYEKLIEEVSVKYREVFKNEINSLNNQSPTNNENKSIELKNSLDDSFAAGKINEVQYNLLKEKLSSQDKK